MRSEFVGVLTAIGFMLALALAFALAVPEDSLSIVVDSVRVHLGAGLLVISILLLSCRAMGRGGLLALVGAIVLWPVFQAMLTVVLIDPDNAPPALHVLNFNILASNRDNGEQIANYIIASGVDLAIIQEAAPLGPYLGALDAAYPYRVGCGEQIARCDSLLLSRLPLADITVLTLGLIFPDRTIIASVAAPAGPIWIVATHMTKPYFDIVGVSEVDRLVGIIGKLQGPLVVAGDFNAGLHAGIMARIVNQAGLVPAPIEPATWPVWVGDFGIPIDHVLARLPARVTSTVVVPDPMGSNHRGLQARIVLAP